MESSYTQVVFYTRKHISGNSVTSINRLKHFPFNYKTLFSSLENATPYFYMDKARWCFQRQYAIFFNIVQRKKLFFTFKTLFYSYWIRHNRVVSFIYKTLFFTIGWRKVISFSSKILVLYHCIDTFILPLSHYFLHWFFQVQDTLFSSLDTWHYFHRLIKETIHSSWDTRHYVCIIG